MSPEDRVGSLLDEVQAEHGYLPKADLRALASRDRGVTLHRLQEVTSFFPHYRSGPPKGLEVRVCRDMACHLAGPVSLKRGIETVAGEIGPDRVEIEGVSCLGRCDNAPAVLVGHRLLKGCSVEAARSAILTALESPGEAARPDLDGGPTGWNIDPYDGREAYAGVRAFVLAPDVAGLIATLKAADLRGMGGAGVFVHQKWSDVRQARGEVKYVVVNGDESEPASFKDREILARAPHLVLVGVILAGLAVGASRGYVYTRHEYEGQIASVRAAIRRAEALGVCGPDVLGTGRAFPVEVFVSPGGYICGEQSALIEAMEGKRAEPRNKPPMLETNGLHDRPTLLGNVESFAWVPGIVAKGGGWYRDLGINDCQGMRFFSISGDVARPGVHEVPIGTNLCDLIALAGGLRDGKALKAVAPSGPSGGFLPARLPRESLPRRIAAILPEGQKDLDVLGLRLDLQAFRDLGLMLGSGLVVYAEGADMLDQARNASEFFRNESCGKCVPCRIGTQKTVDLASGLVPGGHDADSLRGVESLLGELQRTMEMTSICGLGAVALNPIASVFRHFRADLPPTSDREAAR